MTIQQLTLALTVFLCALCSARAEDSKIHYRVKLNVSAPESINAEVTSYLSRELRRIGDIDIVDDDPLLVVSVIALATSNRGGQPTGYTFAVLAERPVRYRQVRENYAAKLDQTMMALMDISFDHTTKILSHFLQLGATDELESLCRKIVATLDGSVFENQRKFTQQLIERMNRSQLPTIK